MSVSGIFTNLFDFGTLSAPSKAQQFRSEFQQLGQHLQSGNLPAVQSDLAALQQLAPQANSTSSASASNPLGQDINQLSYDLQSGNLSAAQQDFSKIRQDLQGPLPAHHHHHGGRGEGNTINQLINQLQDQVQPPLPSSNVSAAQQAYSARQQDLQQFAPSNGLLPSSSPSSCGGLSVSA